MLLKLKVLLMEKFKFKELFIKLKFVKERLVLELEIKYWIRVWIFVEERGILFLYYMNFVWYKMVIEIVYVKWRIEWKLVVFELFVWSL